MLSILIPVYNYKIDTLVHMIHAQARRLAIDFEIICLDDASEADIIQHNEVIQSLSHTQYLKNASNLGRNKTRQILCDTATYDWLLFLDADVIPKKETFISDYMDLIDSGVEAVYGGFAYDDTPPNKTYKLRWEYGRRREEVKAAIRNKRPYKSIISANFLIKKSIFKLLNAQITGNLYGEDNHFGALLKSHSIHVMHIDNEVYHLGIEPSIKYLEKKEQAAFTLLNIYNSETSFEHDNDLLRLFERSKRFKFNYIFAFLFKVFRKQLRNNLLSDQPSVHLLQLYRIGFLCHEDLKAQASSKD